MKPDGKCPDTVEQFINAQVISRGLDERTAIAYRMDLEQFHSWLDLEIKEKREQADSGCLASQVMPDWWTEQELGSQPGLQLAEAETQENQRREEEGREWRY